MFKTETYVQRRNALQEKVGNGLILLLGNDEVGMNYADNIYHFRQDSSFLYYFGIDRPGLAAVIDIAADKTTIFGNDFTLDDTVWMGAQPTLAELAERAGVQHTAAFAKIASHLKNSDDIHFLPPYRFANRRKLVEWLKLDDAALDAKVSKRLIRAVAAQRSIKSPEEIAEMEKATTISGAMHRAVMASATAGQQEAVLAGVAQGIAVGMNGQLSYPVIATVNGQILHNHYHGNVLEDGQLVLGDFGAETELHYAGDITRTFPVAKTFSPQQKEIYDLVLQMMETAFAKLKVGTPYLDVHLAAAKTMVDGLQAIGLMQGDAAEAVEQGAHALFFPHGLGHLIGLDVHDMEDLGEQYVGYSDEVERSTQFGTAALRLGKALEAGFTLTVEPGIYFIPELYEQWKSEGKFTDFINYEKVADYLDFGGIRIEDDVLITEEGYRILGKPIPKTVAEVEALR